MEITSNITVVATGTDAVEDSNYLSVSVCSGINRIKLGFLVNQQHVYTKAYNQQFSVILDLFLVDNGCFSIITGIKRS